MTARAAVEALAWEAMHRADHCDHSQCGKETDRECQAARFTDCLLAFAAAQRAEESAVTWLAAQMLVAKLAQDIERLHEGHFKVGMEFACEEIQARMENGPDSLATTQETDDFRARREGPGL